VELATPPTRATWNILKSITVGAKIGGGNFGDVYKGDWKGTPVALKFFRNEGEFNELEREAAMLQNLNHPQVVKYLGIYKDPTYGRAIVTEFMKKGSLSDVIYDDKDILRTTDLLRIAKQAAQGMSYLAEHKIIHRDVSLRNFLVKEEDSEPYFIKVADFGLSRAPNKSYYTDSRSEIPVKWTAPEALEYGKWLPQSDVFSFGIALWEIFTKGKKPYPELSNAETIPKVISGYRMTPPEDCPKEIAELMNKCWNGDPKLRPTFDEIVSCIEEVWKKDLPTAETAYARSPTGIRTSTQL